jgi:glycosyltransferase involved in cell wall biosynthesis
MSIEHAPPILLVVPTQIRTAQTGGNIYNRSLVAALEAVTGRPCERVDVSRALERLGTRGGTAALVDTLLIEHMPALVEARGRADRIVLLGHSLPSLMPGHSQAHVDQLAARERALLAGIDGVIVLSAVAAKLFGDRVTNTAIWCLPPAVDLALPSGPLGGRPGDPLRALMVSNLVSNKRVAELLEALVSAVSSGQTLSLTVVGHADLEPDYAARCRAVVVHSDELRRAVHFTGPLGREAVAQQLCRADLLVSASAFESFGMVLQEACAFGLPVLACRGGNIEAVLQNGRNRLFDNVGALCSALVSTSSSANAVCALRADRRADARLFDRSWRDVAFELLSRLAGERSFTGR